MVFQLARRVADAHALAAAAADRFGDNGEVEGVFCQESCEVFDSRRRGGARFRHVKTPRPAQPGVDEVFVVVGFD